MFWTVVSEQLDAGISAGGRGRLLAVLRDRFPAHHLFGGPARLPPGPRLPARPIREMIDPFDLEVHPAIDAGAAAEGLPPLPRYVLREHDHELRVIVARAAEGASGIAVLVGGSSTGKTRACWEAIQSLPDEWRLWHPINPGRVEAALDELPRIGPRTVIWLNETQHYLLTTPPEVGERVAAGLRELLRDPDRQPVLILGTLWPDYWETITIRPGAGQPDLHTQARDLVTDADIPLPDAFSGQAFSALRGAASGDPRLADAATHAVDGQITQYLAGAPELLARYRNALPAARALIEAAMDARRFGHGHALPHQLLEAAAPGYLTDQEWDSLDDDWFARALTYTAASCRGACGPLTAIRPRPGQPAPQKPYYRLADYLEQHGRVVRRTQWAPAALWDALVAHAAPDDTLQIAVSADQRRLDRCAFPLFTRAAEAGDKSAALRLVQMLARRRDLDGLQARADAGDGYARAQLTHLLARNGDEDAERNLRDRADARDRHAAFELINLLGGRGDLDELRTRADAGSDFATIELFNRLLERGEQEEAERFLRERVASGSKIAARALVEHLVGRGADQEAERILRADPNADEFSTLRLYSLLAERGDQEAEQLLRTQADDGDPGAHFLLINLLARRGEAEELLTRARQGDQGAAATVAYRLVENGHDEEAEPFLRDLADANIGLGPTMLADLLARRGDLDGLQERVALGNAYAAGPLADLLEQRGDHDEAARLRRFGFNADGSIATSDMD
ncbi:hypothetical protein BL253_36115 [Pseudofrankia asymbiotica]|uniref:Tetratricopeptide repeat protein n=1 Tax=Pseudofrankia asymbiotica TaxID=1834516 RepID=A0A1V2I1Q9_9ACTN|nr:hypothetical protein BL253_36115 [Pseudofrankia asymbiotica]